MKFIFVLFIFGITTPLFSQIPSGYYNSATGTKYTLKTNLHKIIKQNHSDKGYRALYAGYKTTDADNYYEKDGSVLDMYSENPSGTDSYFYTHGNKNCGSYRNEGDCYNREHLFPQSIFYKKSPMRNDIHHVVPSDGKVNGMRSNYPFGEVASATRTSRNGSKRGSSATNGYSGTVFEPIDEFKGDIARCMLYFAVRYEDQASSLKSHAMVDGSKGQFYQTWFINLLMKWHKQDPVNQREKDRNDAAYKFQGNRNPFIDHPEWVNAIWGDGTTDQPTSPLGFSKKATSIYPNPAHQTIFINNWKQLESISIINSLGQIIKTQPTARQIDIAELPSGVYYLILVSTNTIYQKIIIE